MSTYPEKLLGLVDAAVLEFFQSVGCTDVKALLPQDQPPSEDAACFAASLGFSGDHIKGALVLITNVTLLAATNPQRDYGKPLTDSDHGDWIGEMANQILGALKRTAAGYNVDFLLSTPMVMHGKELHISKSLKEAPPAVLWFQVGGQMLRLHFSAKLGDGAKFEGEPTTTDQATSGDALFF